MGISGFTYKQMVVFYNWDPFWATLSMRSSFYSQQQSNGSAQIFQNPTELSQKEKIAIASNTTDGLGLPMIFFVELT